MPVKEGLADNTTDPVPVAVFVPVPPLAILNGVVKVNVPEEIVFAVIAPTLISVDQAAAPYVSDAVNIEPVVTIGFV